MIPCGGRKLDHAAPAGELYAGSYFRANLRAALAQTPTAGCAGIGAQLSILARIAERHAA